MDSEDKYCSSVGLLSEFQVLLYSPWFLNQFDAMMKYILISFEDFQIINVCLRPGKMNYYEEAPGQTSLLKMSKIVVEPIGTDPTLIPH